MVDRLRDARRWVARFVDLGLWHHCSYYRKWQLYRTLQRAKALEKDPEFCRLRAETLATPKVPGPDGRLIIPAPPWMVARMAALRKLPPPTIEQVERQFHVCRRLREIDQSVHKLLRICPRCEDHISICECEKPNE